MTWNEVREHIMKALRSWSLVSADKQAHRRDLTKFSLIDYHFLYSKHNDDSQWLQEALLLKEKRLHIIIFLVVKQKQ